MVNGHKRSSLIISHLITTLMLLLVLQVFSSSFKDPSMKCNGSIAECNEEEEALMDSEISRRFLAEGGKPNFITPGALKPDRPICGQAHQPYTSCLPKPANPYNRGCSKIYKCKS
ncbi:Rapid ALkalinization Factor [Macleaya cordata]|uniref:Rapid ALkalinization Factor n=1 Tax=Macleaya cordata TaxID=56857 RepID=A0A200Q5M2_MACCD|nr:Rapid ALkalinization Factor [Macleaya cordata]